MTFICPAVKGSNVFLQPQYLSDGLSLHQSWNLEHSEPTLNPTNGNILAQEMQESQKTRAPEQ